MFTKTAAYYDALYHFVDYKTICEKLRDLVSENLPEAKTLLDVGCGTGKHLSFLKDSYAAEGLDIDGALLEIAKENCPGVTFHEGDMRSFQLGKKFDVVTCLFSSIGYVKTNTALNDSIRAMAKHLNPGGLLVVEPWIWPENYWLDRITANFVDQPELKIAWMYTSKKEGNVSVFDIHYMVGTPRGVDEFTERHEMGLWTDAQYKAAFESAGIENVEFIRTDYFRRGMYYGRKK
ncbi:class I SAM-dependent DNA methyltransferase [Flavihumibacter fluvii]|uniref:class I SAM-dependent DNA methyltransferase n=1 Tax=Flavihumibacter fluvii TaxID=2838157 RepID=UPI001BDE7C6A|nr:class I SAM-dependent methyltransferase [Flavihumibacter fluvii]ULQ52433.1 class I SAM-dependent methyltransferase [Flavihumibacter fluvii]